MKEPMVIMESFDKQRDFSSYRFEGLQEVISAYEKDQLIPALIRVEEAVAAGRHAAGFISFEGAAGLNPDLKTMPMGDFPLLWFGIFEKRLAIHHSSSDMVRECGPYLTSDWRTSMPEEDYGLKVERI